MASSFGVRTLRAIGNSDGMIGALPFASGWTKSRFMPAPTSGKTFRALYARRTSH